MQISGNHISVCICTFKRVRLLERLLRELQGQRTEGLFTYSIIVVDNDHGLSAQPVVVNSAKNSPIAIDYYVEPEESIPRARNKAVKKAQSNYIAFIDDDEFPDENWLLNLYTTLEKYGGDGVLGPVRVHFDITPPEWIIRANILEREPHATGSILHWEDTRTGNVLLHSDIFQNEKNRFDPRFKHGEDKDFFRRMMAEGYTFIWSDNATVYETYGPDRFKRIFYLKRALTRGAVSLRHHKYGLPQVLKSIIAFLIYTPALPFLFLLGQPMFMKYLIKDCDHLGKLLSAVGIDVDKYLKYA